MLTDFLATVGRPVAYYPNLAQCFGSINASIFFCQLFYWQERIGCGAEGVFKTSTEWKNETGMSYREQATARKLLASLGILLEVHRRLEHRIYFRLDLDRANQVFEAWLAATGRISRTPDAQSPNDENAFREPTEAQFVNKEEITSEITSSPPIPPKASLRGKQSASKSAGPELAEAGSRASLLQTINSWLASCKQRGEQPIPAGDAVFRYAETVGIGSDLLRLCWSEFKRRSTEAGGRQKDWRRKFRNCVEGNWYGLWYLPAGEPARLSSKGEQAKRFWDAADTSPAAAEGCAHAD